jgi:hypothetical protein
VEIDGTAGGGFCDHYALEWRLVGGLACQDNTTRPRDGFPDPVTGWSCAGTSHPGGGSAGTIPVVGGTLAWLDTTVLGPASYEVRVCVYSTVSQRARCCFCIQFDLFKVMVWIERIAGAPVKRGPGGPFSPDSPIVSGNPGGLEVAVGCCVTVKGSAFVGICNNRKVKCFDLRWGLGFLPGPGQSGFKSCGLSWLTLVLSAGIGAGLL